LVIDEASELAFNKCRGVKIVQRRNRLDGLPDPICNEDFMWSPCLVSWHGRSLSDQASVDLVGQAEPLRPSKEVSG
jgi:hypothetical protein